MEGNNKRRDMKQEESKVKSIEEYKTDLISIVKEIEEEHGCKISRVIICAEKRPRNIGYYRTYNVEIEL